MLPMSISSSLPLIEKAPWFPSWDPSPITVSLKYFNCLSVLQNFSFPTSFDCWQKSWQGSWCSGYYLEQLVNSIIVPLFCFQWNYRVLSSLWNNGTQLPHQGFWTNSIPTSWAVVLTQLSLKMSIQTLQHCCVGSSWNARERQHRVTNPGLEMLGM